MEILLGKGKLPKLPQFTVMLLDYSCSDSCPKIRIMAFGADLLDEGLVLNTTGRYCD